MITYPLVYRENKRLRAAGGTWTEISATTGLALSTLARIRAQAVADGRATKANGRVTL